MSDKNPTLWRNRMNCDRNGCHRYANWRIRFDRYSDHRPTQACDEHARWWCHGLWGRPIGQRHPISRKRVR